MTRLKSPPIQWLPVFEASARLLSFKKAAESLHVTPPAVSQQIKVLENYLDQTLFDRRGRKLKLTTAGEYYYQVALRVMSQHHLGFEEFDRRFNHRSLRVSTPLFIAQELLIPNYMSFKKLKPDSDLRITTGSEYVDFKSEEIDAAIRFGDGLWPDLDCRLISHVQIGAVCSRDYLAAENLDIENCYSFEVLNRLTLISNSEELQDWTAVFPELNPKNRIICDSYFAVIKAAEKGLGVAPGIFPAINPWINDRRLNILPLEQTIETNSGYWLVSPKHAEQSELIDTFYHWAKTLFSQLPELEQPAMKKIES